MTCSSSSKTIRRYKTDVVLFTCLLLISTACQPAPQETPEQPAFDSELAYAYIEQQVSFGPRYPGSAGHESLQSLIQTQLLTEDWEVELQQTSGQNNDKIAKNIIAHHNPSSEYWILIGAHYDTRLVSDQESDPEAQNIHVLGANDGASGTAVLLSLARNSFPDLQCHLSLAFFDLEDQGHLDGQVWSAGAQQYVDQTSPLPNEVIIIDMIGDEDLNIYKEKNSTKWLTNSIWKTAEELGYENVVINEYKYSIIDDHLPFIQKGVPAALLIDFDYPYWHTNNDTLDHVSPDSLKAVGETLLMYLMTHPECVPHENTP